jgi:hypothetical protein
MAICFSLKKAKTFFVGMGLVVCAQCAMAAELYSGDFLQILQSNTAQTTVWQYADNPEVYIFDFAGLSNQGKTFNRITQFTEQRFGGEAYPRVLGNEDLARHITAARRTQANFAFGHDLLVSELVQFFNFAQRDKVQLNAEELELRDFLVERNFMREMRGFYQSLKPDVVILSIPQVQDKKQDEPMVSPGARYAILLHEMGHAEYYSNPHYAKYCQRFWSETLTEQQRELFKKFLRGYNYSVDNEDLVINEMQAYLMFTPDPKSFSAKKLGVSEAELESIRSGFRKGKPPIRLPMNLVEGY